MLNTLKFNDLYLSENDAAVKENGGIHSLCGENRKEALGLFAVALSVYEEKGRTEFTIVHDDQRYRVVLIDSILGYEFVLRKITPLINKWGDLGFPPHYLPRLLNAPTINDPVARGGLILITGRPDTGKSTTAYALLNEVMQRMPWVAMTIEDPVETLLPAKYQTGGKVIQREVLSRDFSQALHGALRSNVDVILVGEIRDKEGAQLALSAAHTGHLVITTLHAKDLISALERFANIAGADERTLDLMSQVFRGCIWQSLEKWAGLKSRVLDAHALFSGEDGSVESRIRAGQFSQLTNNIIKQKNLEGSRGIRK